MRAPIADGLVFDEVTKVVTVLSDDQGVNG
jgi:hypothetical protein